MTLEQALGQLKPFQPKVPADALEVIRNHWNDAEPVLLAEMDRRLERPVEESRSALFLYALYLCAEMRCEAAFERYVRILRLPNLLLDALIGDILTEDMNQMLARTCGGRGDALKALVEDETVNEYARSQALMALVNLVAAGTFAREEAEQYCVDLLARRLERRPSHIWDAAATMAEKLHIKAALPLIETAYQRGWTDSGFQSFEEIKSALSTPHNEGRLTALREKTAAFDTAREISFFARNWVEKDNLPEPDPMELLEEPRAARRRSQSKTAKIGRNEPCPCGSGKKYKKCCIDRKDIPASEETPEDGDLLNLADEWIAAGYYYLEQDWPHKALTCWWQGWREAQSILPKSVQAPDTEDCNELFASCDFFSNWLQDYLLILEENFERNAVAAQNGLEFCRQAEERFPVMSQQLKYFFMEIKSRLLLALGSPEEAFSVLTQIIELQPNSARGYVVLAEILSEDALRFNLRPDIDRARELLLQARDKATDCEDWDVEIRLEDL